VPAPDGRGSDLSGAPPYASGSDLAALTLYGETTYDGAARVRKSAVNWRPNVRLILRRGI